MKRKTSTHTARKQCQKCQQFGWYRPRERKCKHVTTRLGQAFYCWGPLLDAPIRRGGAVSASDAPEHRHCPHCGCVNLNTRTQCNGCNAPLAKVDTAGALRARGASHRRLAERKLDAVRRRMGDTKDGIDRLVAQTKREVERLRRLLAKQQHDERKWSKEAAMTDDALAARRERARHAAHVSAKVQRVRRRLSASASMFEDADAAAAKLRLRLARKRVHGVLMQQRARRRRAQTRAAARP